MPLYVFGNNNMSQLGLGEDVYVVKSPTLHNFFEGVDVVKCAAGVLHSLILTSENKLYSFGCNDEFVLGREGEENIPIEVKIPGKIVDMVAGTSYSAVLLASGDVYAWGTFRGTGSPIGFSKDRKFQKEPLKLNVKKIRKIVGGQNHFLMMDANKRIFTYGAGAYGELGWKLLRRDKRGGLKVKNFFRNTRNFSAAEIGAGANQSFVLSTKGECYGYGKNNNGELGVAHNINTHIKQKVPLDNLKIVRGGEGHTLFLKKDGTLYSSGTNAIGQLGVEGINQSEVPVKIDIENVEEVSTVSFFSMVKTKDGLYTWGPNYYGELGYQTKSNQFLPKKIPFDFGEIVSFAAGHDFSLVASKKK